MTYKTIPVTPVLASYLVDNFTQHLLYMRGQMPLYVTLPHRLRLKREPPLPTVTHPQNLQRRLYTLQHPYSPST